MSTNKLLKIVGHAEPKKKGSKALSWDTVQRMRQQGHSNAIKTVHHKKKDGTFVDYFYIKDKYNTLVDSSGKTNDEAVKIYLDQMRADGASPSTIERAKQEIKIFAKEQQSNRDGESKRLSTLGLQARLAENSWLTMFWNAGIDPSWAAGYAGTTVAELSKDENWDKPRDTDEEGKEGQYTFTNPDTKRKFVFIWDYYNSIWEEV